MLFDFAYNVHILGLICLMNYYILVKVHTTQMCSAVQCCVYWSLCTSLQVFRLRLCVCVFVHGCVRLSLSLSVYANACTHERRNTSSRGTRKMHYKYCTQDTHRNLSNMQLHAVECEEQLNLAHHDTEKSGRLIQDNPCRLFFFPKNNFSPPYLQLMQEPCPVLCYWSAVSFSSCPQQSASGPQLSNALGPPSSYSMTIQLGFEASPKATQTKINVGTVGEVFMQFFFSFLIAHSSPCKNGENIIDTLSVQWERNASRPLF